MSLHRWTLLIGMLGCGISFATAHAENAFDSVPVKSLPFGWTIAETGACEGNIWEIRDDATSPAGRKVMTQTSSAGFIDFFNLCVTTQPKFADLNLSVALKPLSGETDQGGGLVWRYQEENSYYLVRWNPLEGDFRLFRVIDGKRTQLGETVKIAARLEEWHTIAVQHHGDHIVCLFDHQQHFDLHDSRILQAGGIGLWTKADAVTSFAAPEISGIPVESSPKEVLVINTQDASVSLVDLTAMKETARHAVGPRPYGIAVSRDGKTVAIGVEDEECVKFFSFPDFKLKGKTAIGKMFNDHIVLTQDGQSVMVANFYSDDVMVINMETMKGTGRITGCSAPHVVKYGPLKQRAFVTCKKVTGIALIDPNAQKLIKFHQLNVNPRSLTFSSDESKVYFGSFWVNGFYEMDTESGKVQRLFSYDPPAENTANQEVTYHGVEAIGNHIVLAANEGRSFVDAVDVSTGKLLDRLMTVNKPCCVERIPGSSDPIRVLVSNIGDGTLHFVEVGADGKMHDKGYARVGKAPKRVAFLPVVTH